MARPSIPARRGDPAQRAPLIRPGVSGRLDVPRVARSRVCWMITVLYPVRITSPVPKRYPPEFRRKVLDLVAAGRRVAQVAADLDISEQTIYGWRRQELIDTGQLPGTTSSDNAELVAARRRIAELVTEVA